MQFKDGAIGSPPEPTRKIKIRGNRPQFTKERVATTEGEIKPGIQKTALRLPMDIHAYIQAQAKKNNRSMNAEIIHRLEQSWVDDRNRPLVHSEKRPTPDSSVDARNERLTNEYEEAKQLFKEAGQELGLTMEEFLDLRLKVALGKVNPSVLSPTYGSYKVKPASFVKAAASTFIPLFAAYDAYKKKEELSQVDPDTESLVDYLVSHAEIEPPSSDHPLNLDDVLSDIHHAPPTDISERSQADQEKLMADIKRIQERIEASLDRLDKSDDSRSA